MFKRFFERRKERLLEQELANDPIMQLIMHNTQKNWHEVGILSALSSETAEIHHRDFLLKVQKIMAADNILVELRKQICNAVIGYSEYMTVTITPEDKQHLFIKDSPYVTGELTQHLGKDGTSDLLDKFKEMYFNNPDTSAQDLRDFSNLAMAITNFFVEGLDLLRIHLEDYNKINYKKDWMRPFQIAMAECCEYRHRKTLDLPQLMDSSTYIKKSIFLNKVLDEANPLMEYEAAIKRIGKID